MKRLNKVKVNKNEKYIFLKNYPTINEITGGFKKNEIIIIAARPGCGKTTLALNLMTELAEQKIRCGFFSLEMNGDELVNRLVNVDPNLPIFIEDSNDIDMEKIEKEIKKTKLDVVFIDYIQLMNGSVKKNSIALKQLSRKYKIPFFVLAQLNRNAQSKTPTLAMLKDSGSLEQDADQVWFITESQITVAKNRKGRTGDIEIFFDKDNFKIVEEYYGDEFGEDYYKSCEEQMIAKKALEKTLAKDYEGIPKFVIPWFFGGEK